MGANTALLGAILHGDRKKIRHHPLKNRLKIDRRMAVKHSKAPQSCRSNTRTPAIFPVKIAYDVEKDTVPGKIMPRG